MKFAFLLFPIIILMFSSCSQISFTNRNFDLLVEDLKPVPAFSISGKVIVKGSDKPIYGAQVFIGNTTLNNYTDSAGRFKISNVPAGDYYFVVFTANVEPFTQRITIESNISNVVIQLPVSMSFVNNISEDRKIGILENEIRRLKERNINEKRYILNNLKIYLDGIDDFTNVVVGNPDECKVLNPESIIVEPPDEFERNTLEFSSTKPIEVLNLHLGYLLKIILKRCVYSNRINGYSVKNDAIICFEELDKSKYPFSASDKWQFNRMKSFYGSKRHFLIALAAKKLEDEGFIVNLAPIEKKQIDHGLGSARGRMGSDDEESYPFEQPYSILRRAGTEDYEYALHFQLELEVSNRLYFLNSLEKHFKGLDKDPISRITLLNFPAIFNSNGILKNESYLFVTGYWAIDQYYKKLPNNYLPE